MINKIKVYIFRGKSHALSIVNITLEVAKTMLELRDTFLNYIIQV